MSTKRDTRDQDFDRGSVDPLRRITAAVEGSLSIEELSVDELAIYDDLESLQRWARSKAGNPELAKTLMSQAGNVGYDDAGNLLETTGDGQKVRVIGPPPDGK